METELKDKPHLLKNVAYILKLIWGISPKRVLFCALKSMLIYFVGIYSSVIFIRYIFNSIDAGTSFMRIVWFVIFSIMLYMGIELYNLWYTKRFEPIADCKIYASLCHKVFAKATDVELSCYEDPEFYNRYTMAMSETEDRYKSVLNNIFNIISSTVSVFTVYYILFSIDKFTALIVVFPLIGNFVFGVINNKLIYKRYIENVPYFRKRDYVNRVVYLQEYSKEFRLTNAYEVIRNKYNEAFDGLFAVYKKFAKKLISNHYAVMIFSYLIVFQGLLFYGAYRAIVSHSISMSEFAVFASAMFTASFSIRSLAESIIKISDDGLYIGNFRGFLDYTPQISESTPGIIPSKTISSIEFRNVSFHYTGKMENIIENVSFIIHGKEKVVLVGHNGAGKSTIIKLLLRLYDPSEGQILINGVDIREYDLKAYRNLFGVAFQDYRIFAMTVAENVLMRAKENELDIETVKSALKASGAYSRVNSLDNSIDAILTREFDDNGNILSGGENQKIAISRAFAKESSIAVFDEPSSALDPVAENILYENIRQFAKNKTVFYISHRLSSAVYADRILMFDNGKLCESGSHSELFVLDGKYADMYRKQAENYV